ncbi:MAG: hypothetical protein EOO52_14120 [Gammaproteobacteria bacterium]|nr:MAG: hypothetical protein EOO52_14120 [Gammaproteobacteria bacterium]
MSTQKSGWLLLTLVIACIGCCAVPLYTIVVGISGVGALVGLMNFKTIEMLICLAPLLLIAIYLHLRRHQSKKVCCSTPSTECDSTQCSNRE